MSPLQTIKLHALDFTHLSKDALHIYVGLTILFAVAISLRLSLRDWRPITAVAVAAFAGELWDIADRVSDGSSAKWAATWKDILNTMFWPAVLFVLARFTNVLVRPPRRRQ